MGNTPLTSPRKPPPRGPKGRRRDITVQPSSYRWLIHHRILPWLRENIFRAGPSIFTPSPKERAQATQLARSRLTYVMRHHVDANKRPPPPGHVRVQFFLSLDMIQYVGRKPNLEADLPLEPTGEFDMRRVRDLWGLETCAPVDPIRWNVFTPASDRISPLGVATLSEHFHTLRFIEPHVSRPTAIKRRIRDTIVPLLVSLDDFGSRISRFLGVHALLVVWLSHVQTQRRVVEWRLERWVSEHEELGKMIAAILILAFIVFVISVMEGFIEVDFGVKERAGGWMGMRTTPSGLVV